MIKFYFLQSPDKKIALIHLVFFKRFVISFGGKDKPFIFDLGIDQNEYFIIVTFLYIAFSLEYFHGKTNAIVALNNTKEMLKEWKDKKELIQSNIKEIFEAFLREREK